MRKKVASPITKIRNLLILNLKKKQKKKKKQNKTKKQIIKCEVVEVGHSQIFFIFFLIIVLSY